MINVYKCTLNARERFYLVLQSLGNVMRLPQRSIRIHDNVKFDEVVLMQGHWSAGGVEQEMGRKFTYRAAMCDKMQ